MTDTAGRERAVVDGWQKVLGATDGHNIDTITVQLDDAKSWTYIRCTCGIAAFDEAWEFTDHIRRLVWDAIKDTP